jgi:hypothetical protein
MPGSRPYTGRPEIPRWPVGWPERSGSQAGIAMNEQTAGAACGRRDAESGGCVVGNAAVYEPGHHATGWIGVGAARHLADDGRRAVCGVSMKRPQPTFVAWRWPEWMKGQIQREISKRGRVAISALWRNEEAAR